MGKGKRTDVYLEVRKRRGAYIFLMKQMSVTYRSHLGFKRDSGSANFIYKRATGKQKIMYLKMGKIVTRDG